MDSTDNDLDLAAVAHPQLDLEALPEAASLSTYSTASTATTASCPISSATSIATANCYTG